MSKLAEKQVAFAEQIGKESHRFAFESAPPPRDPFATAPFAMERDADKPAHNKTVTLKDLKELLDSGLLTLDEFTDRKA